ncbi:hypothetical protein ACMYSQ_004624 [Aspergillus niger]
MCKVSNQRYKKTLDARRNKIIPRIIQLCILTLFTTVILPQAAEPGNLTPSETNAIVSRDRITDVDDNWIDCDISW